MQPTAQRSMGELYTEDLRRTSGARYLEGRRGGGGTRTCYKDDCDSCVICTKL